jgi:hypothetical protein
MGLLSDLETYLRSKNALPVEYSVFHDFAPSAPAEIIVLFEYAGMPAPEFLQRSVQVSCRSSNADDAKKFAWDMYEALNIPYSKEVLLGTTIVLVHIRQTPFKITSDADSITYGFNIGVTTNITI